MAEALSFCISCSLWNSHQKWPNGSLFFSSSSCVSLCHTLAECPFLLFFSFSFSSACTTCLGSLLIKRSQTSHKSWSFLNKWESWIWRLLEQAHKWALTKCVCWNPKGVTCTQHFMPSCLAFRMASLIAIGFFFFSITIAIRFTTFLSLLLVLSNCKSAYKKWTVLYHFCYKCNPTPLIWGQEHLYNKKLDSLVWFQETHLFWILHLLLSQSFSMHL